MRNSRGYLLLTTLLMIAITTFALVAVARASLATSRGAISRARDQQLRWGAVSLERWSIRHAPQLLSTQPAAGSTVKKLASRNFQIRLGECEFLLVLADEQAKLNLNHLLERRSLPETESLLRQFVPATGPDIALEPHKDSAISRRQKNLNSWGSVFLESRENSSSSFASLRSATTQITLWGLDEKLNYTNAPDKILLEIARLEVNANQASKLVELRREQPALPLAEQLAKLDLKSADQAGLVDSFTEASNTFSTWTEGSCYTSKLRRFLVSEGVGNASSRYYVWEW